MKSNSDLCEGRGTVYIKYLCESKSTAIRLAKGAYVQGSDSPVVAVTALFHNNLWYFPGGLVIPPTDADVETIMVQQSYGSSPSAAPKVSPLRWERSRPIGITTVSSYQGAITTSVLYDNGVVCQIDWLHLEFAMS